MWSRDGGQGEHVIANVGLELTERGDGRGVGGGAGGGFGETVAVIGITEGENPAEEAELKGAVVVDAVAAESDMALRGTMAFRYCAPAMARALAVAAS